MRYRVSRWVQIEDAVNNSKVNLSISDRQPFCVGFSKVCIDDTRFGDGLASTRWHCGAEVHTYNPSSRPHPPCGNECVRPRAAAQVQNGCPDRNFRKQRDIGDTRKSIARHTRQAGKQVCRVAEAFSELPINWKRVILFWVFGGCGVRATHLIAQVPPSVLKTDIDSVLPRILTLFPGGVTAVIGHVL